MYKDELIDKFWNSVLSQIDRKLEKLMEDLRAQLTEDFIIQHSDIFTQKELQDLLCLLEHPESNKLKSYFIYKIKYIIS